MFSNISRTDLLQSELTSYRSTLKDYKFESMGSVDVVL